MAAETMAQAAAGAPARTVLDLPGGLRICVPDDPGLITPYVLREQGDWFEPEIAFVRALLCPGMRAVDVGANYGVYALSMAAAVADAGRVWAFEPASSTCGFLRESIALNRLANLVPVQAALSEHPGRARLFLHGSSELNSLADADATATGSEEVEVQTLDQAAQALGWESIEFLKIDAEGEECRILNGGERFFREQSPLVMFELMHGTSINLPLLEQFRGMGYPLYRLVPGPGLLAPFSPELPHDAFQLNLFACKDDCAALLEQRGLLARAPEAPEAVPARWPDAIPAMEFAKAFAADWVGAGAGRDAPGRDAYLAGLDALLLACARERSAALRYGALLRAVDLLREACARAPCAGRRATLSRALFALGRRAQGLQVIEGLIGELAGGASPDLSEPFLPPSERFEAVPVPGRPAPWFLAALLERQELLGHWSSFYMAGQSVPRLRRIRELGFADSVLQRRETMAARREAATRKSSVAPGPEVPRWMQEAIGLLQAGDPGRAESVCARILGAAPDFPDGLHLAGVVALRLGNAALAVQRLERAAAAAPGDALVLVDLANALMTAGRPLDSEVALRRSLGLQPRLPQAHFNLGNLLVQQGRVEEAAAAYRRAVELEPRFLEARANLGNALTTLRRLDEAEKAFRDALALAPGHPMLLLNLGNVLKELGRFAEAEACHRQALAAEPRFPLAQLNLGFALQAQGRLDEAAACFERAAELAPDFVEAHCALGNLQQERGQSDAAIAAYRRAAAAAPGRGDILGKLARALEAAGRHGEAAVLRGAVAPDRADAGGR